MWTLEEFNGLAPNVAAEGLLACCASVQWAEKVVAGRTFGSLAELRAAAEAAFDELDAEELELAYAAHPPIGGPIQQQSGGPMQGQSGGPTSIDTTWSRDEQARAQSSDVTVRSALAEVNRAYERKFGRVFLICATGLSGEEILAEARRRLVTDQAAETQESTRQLRAIVLLRLGKAVRL